MFTGIIEAIGEIVHVQDIGGDRRFRICTSEDLQASLDIGDSVAVNGVCLTVIHLHKAMFDVDVSNETLSCTALGEYEVGHKLNLERALTLSGRLDGHLVSGHVDSTATIMETGDDGRSRRMLFATDPALMRYIVHKGSICVDGTSLTVNSVENNRFSINIIPHTLEHTIMSEYRTGTRVNIEVDLVARYIENMLPANFRL